MEKHTSATVGENLARIRARVGMTTRVLAASVAENGLAMSSSGITDIERGRRSVSVDQLTALAAALGVSPVTLLTPIPDDESPDTEVILSGTSPERASDMHLWLRGDRSLTDDMLDDFEREAFRRLANPPWTWRTRRGGTDGR